MKTKKYTSKVEKTNFPYRFTSLLACLLFFAFIAIGNAQNCAADLSVKKNRSYKSVNSKNGAVYHLILTNKSASDQLFTISVKESEVDCSNKHLPSKRANVSLNVELIDSKNKVLVGNQIKIGAGQAISFKAKVTAYQNTPLESWGCIELQAVSNKCRTVSDSTLLKAYVPNSADGE